MMRLPSGKKKGAKFAAPLWVTCCLLLPSASITQISRLPGRISPRVERLVVGDFRRGLGLLGAIDDFLAVIGKERAAVVAEFVRQLADVAAVGVHGVNIEIAIARGGEDDFLAVAADGRLGIVVPGASVSSLRSLPSGLAV